MSEWECTVRHAFNRDLSSVSNCTYHLCRNGKMDIIIDSWNWKSFTHDNSFSECFPFFVSQVTIIIYLSVVGALLLYMLFLLLVDPLIRKHDPYTQPLHNEEDSEVTLQTRFCLYVFNWMWNPWNYSVYLFVFRRCVHKWTAARPEETLSWSGLRGHSSAGKNRSRNSARLFLTATRCLVKLYRWP